MKKSQAILDIGKDASVPWRPSLQSVWRTLEGGLTLGDLAEIHTGVRYKTGWSSECVRDESASDLTEGVGRVKGYIEAYLISDYRYLCTKPEVIRNGAYKLPWERPKVLVNGVRSSHGYWQISGTVDFQGHWASHRFHGMWPRGATRVELLAALINGPIANAFLFTPPWKREIPISSLEPIPVPRFTDEQEELVVSLVQEYYSQRGQWTADPNSGGRGHRCLELLYQIDAAVLEAYALPAGLERALLDKFDGQSRPLLPFRFPGYGEAYEHAKDELLRERRYRATLRRYHMLVDKKYVAGLTSMESDEVERLRRRIDEHNAPFYEPILQSLAANQS